MIPTFFTLRVKAIDAMPKKSSTLTYTTTQSTLPVLIYTREDKGLQELGWLQIPTSWLGERCVFLQCQQQWYTQQSLAKLGIHRQSHLLHFCHGLLQRNVCTVSLYLHGRIKKSMLSHCSFVVHHTKLHTLIVWVCPAMRNVRYTPISDINFCTPLTKRKRSMEEKGGPILPSSSASAQSTQVLNIAPIEAELVSFMMNYQ